MAEYVEPPKEDEENNNQPWTLTISLNVFRIVAAFFFVAGFLIRGFFCN